MAKIQFGTKDVEADVEGKKYGEIPVILENFYDIEVPENVEIVADGQVKDPNDVIPEGVNQIELLGLAGQKQTLK